MVSNPVTLPTEIHKLSIDELDADISERRASLRSCLFVSPVFHRCARHHLFREVGLDDAQGSPRFQHRILLLREMLKTTANDGDPGIVSDVRIFSLLLWFEDDGESIEDTEGGDDSEESEFDEYSEHSEGEQESKKSEGEQESEKSEGRQQSDSEKSEGEEVCEHSKRREVSTHSGDEEEFSVTELTERYLPDVIDSLLSDASRLQELVIQDASTNGCSWISLSLGLQRALQSLLAFGKLRKLELRNFDQVPNNIFDGGKFTHLVTDSFYSIEHKHEDLAIISAVRSGHITFPPLESLETDQNFPLQWILDISTDQSSNESRPSLLRQLKLAVHNVVDFNEAVYLLRAAPLVEELSLTLVPLDTWANVGVPAKLDLFPLQKLTCLTLFHVEELDTSSPYSSPKSVEQTYALLKSASPSITLLTLTFFFTFPNWVAMTLPALDFPRPSPDDGIYQPKREHWKSLDNLLSGSSYPALRRLELRIPVHPALKLRLAPGAGAAIKTNEIRLREAMPLLSAFDKLMIHLES